MNTQENNKMIAEFMGLKYYEPFFEVTDESQMEKIEVREGKVILFGYMFEPHELKYHASWGWLMHVVEKIESLGYEFFIVEDRVEVSHNTDHSIETIIDLTFGGSKRDATYQGVVEFINQYNNNESTD